MAYPAKADRKKSCPRCGKYVPTYARTCWDCDWDFNYSYRGTNVGKKTCPRCGEMIPNAWKYHTCGWRF